MKIPITMCHGLRDEGKNPLTADHFDVLMRVAAELKFNSINYDQLDAWKNHGAELPPRPIMFDFDHPVIGMLGCQQIMDRYGFHGNLFINTGMMHAAVTAVAGTPPTVLTWDQLRTMRDQGWHMGAHTVTHPNLSKLSLEDPSGEKIAKELDDSNAELTRELGAKPKDFAYTGTSFSSTALREVKKRYRFARLWITQALYDVDGKKVRYADFLGIPGNDEPDGGPPNAARYIYRESDPYLLPSMEFQYLLYEPAAFRAHLEGALTAS